MSHDLSSPVQYIKGVGPHRAQLLARIGINNARDALFYLPYRYEDRSSTKKIVHLTPDKLNTISGRILKADLISPGFGRSKLKIFEVVITDGSALLTVKWFNQGYLKKVFSPGQEVVFYGMVKHGFRGAGYEMVNPEYELLDGNDDDTNHLHTGRIVPIYRSTEGLSQKQLRNIIFSVIETQLSDIQDTVPAEIIKAYALHDLRESLHNVHFPPASSLDDLNSGTSPFHQRLAFDELFTLQLGLAAIKKGEALEKGILFTPDKRYTNILLNKLPFKLTSAQEKVLS